MGDLRTAGIDLRFARAHAQVRDYTARLGHEQLVGLAHPWPSVAAAVAEPSDTEHRYPKGAAP